MPSSLWELVAVFNLLFRFMAPKAYRLLTVLVIRCLKKINESEYDNLS